MPEAVIRGSKLKYYIERNVDILFTDEEVVTLCDKISHIKDNITKDDYRIHGETVHNRYHNMGVCQKCGGKMLVYKFTEGSRKGQEYLGCENYPKCLYRRELKIAKL